MKHFTCEAFRRLEPDIRHDFLAAINEASEDIDANLTQIHESAAAAPLIDSLFRHVHSIKSNCRMVFLDPLADMLHRLEDSLSAARGNDHFSTVHAECVLHTIEKCRTMIGELSDQGWTDGDTLERMEDALHRIALAENQTARDQACRAMLDAAGPAADTFTRPHGCLQPPEDLVLMQTLARRLDRLHFFREGRTQQQIVLCKRLNEASGFGVDALQLEAAVLMHDIGMAFVPPPLLSKETSLSQIERAQLRAHVEVGAQLLARMGWAEAASIAMQHHERVDGSGYPAGLSGDAIHPGAQMIAVVDSFYAMTNLRPDRSYKKGLFSAVTEINANANTQFSWAVVEAFNRVIRSHYLRPNSHEQQNG